MGQRGGVFFSRIEKFMNNDPGEIPFQAKHSYMAIATGGITGKGPGKSEQRNILPHPYSDFIYAIICEEYGIAGGAMLIGLYLLLFFRVTRLVTKSPKAFGAMVALGLCLMLVTQAFFHVGINLKLLPVTGLNLPLVSMGGSSLLFSCIAFGIILSVSKYVEAVAD
jgi:cell division protein FtsW